MEKALLEQFKTELVNDILADRNAIRKMFSEKQESGTIRCTENVHQVLSDFACESEELKAAFTEEFNKFFDVFMFNLYGRMLVKNKAFAEVFQTIDLKTFLSLEDDFEKIRPGTYEIIKTAHVDFGKFLQDLDDRCIQKLLKATDQSEWVIALKGSDEATLNKVVRNMPKAAGRMLLEDLEFCGPVRECDNLMRRWKLLSKFFELQENGDVTIHKSHPFSDDLNQFGVTDDVKNTSHYTLID